MTTTVQMTVSTVNAAKTKSSSSEPRQVPASEPATRANHKHRINDVTLVPRDVTTSAFATQPYLLARPEPLKFESRLPCSKETTGNRKTTRHLTPRYILNTASRSQTTPDRTHDEGPYR